MSSCCLQSSESSKDAEERFRAAFEEARTLWWRRPGDSGDPMFRVSYAHARASLSDKRHHLKLAVRQAYAKYIGGLTRDIIVSWERRQNFWRYVERLKSVKNEKASFFALQYSEN